MRNHAARPPSNRHLTGLFPQLVASHQQLNKTLFTAAVLCLLFSPLLRAQQALSLAEAVRIALAQNPAVKASEAAENGAAERLAQARAGYLPEVNYSESLQWGNNPVYVFGSLLEQHRFRSSNFELGSLNRPDALTNFASQLAVNQVVFDGHRTRNRLRAATLGREMASEHGRRSEMDVLLAVVEAYYGAALAAENLAVAEETLRAAQSDLERAQALRDTGMSTGADVLALQVRLAEIEDQRIRAQNGREVSLAQLNDALGAPLGTRYDLSTPLRPVALSAVSLEEYERMALQQRPEARQAEAALGLAETETRLARSSLLPELAVHGVFEANRQSFASGGGSNWMTGATLRWNLFRGFADRARVAEASFLKTQREQEKQRTHSALQLEVRRFFLGLQAAGHRVEVAQTAVAAAEENHRIVADRYEAGLSNVTELLRSQAALSAARLRRLAAVFDQRIASARLARAAGSLNPSSEALQP